MADWRTEKNKSFWKTISFWLFFGNFDFDDYDFLLVFVKWASVIDLLLTMSSKLEYLKRYMSAEDPGSEDKPKKKKKSKKKAKAKQLGG